MSKIDPKQVAGLIPALEKLGGIETGADKTTAQKVESAGAAMKESLPAFGFARANGNSVTVNLDKEVPINSGLIIQAFDEEGQSLPEVSISDRSASTIEVSGVVRDAIVSVIAIPN